MEGGNDGLLVVPWGQKTTDMKNGMTIRSSEILRWISGISLWYLNGRETTWIWLALENPKSTTVNEVLVSEAHVVSLIEVERVGRVTPITSANLRRVDTEEWRRWWELCFAAGSPGCEREEMVFEDECEDGRGMH
jgi:hypothetical protein